MALQHFVIFCISFGIVYSDYGSILNFDQKSIQFLAETNVTFKATLSLINTTNNQSDQFYVQLDVNREGINLSPSSLEFFLPPNETLQESEVQITAYKCGYAEIFATNESQIDDISEAFIRITVYKSDIIQIVIQVVGYIYLVAWSLSFYPQTYSNFKNKSVVGFNFDYAALNLVGHISYCTFNVGLFYFPYFQSTYFSKHPHGVNPVQLNDVLFSTHAVFAATIQAIQCCIYERGGQKISKLCYGLLAIILVTIIIGLTLAITNVHDYLSFLYFFSYIKLAITFLKYCPQAFQNFQRKSTKGWSIGYVILDISGGLCSISQMIMIAYNFEDWESIVGDLGKLGLGAVSVLFDVLFFIQHYILYRNAEVKKGRFSSQIGLVVKS